MRTYEILSKRKRQKFTKPVYRAGDVVLLRSGQEVTLTRVVVRDWTTDFVAGETVYDHHQIERRVR